MKAKEFINTFVELVIIWLFVQPTLQTIILYLLIDDNWQHSLSL